MEDAHLYQRIAEAVRRDIIDGKVQPGSKLPTIRMMTAKWRCTPGTIQRAYHELAKQGLVISRTGRGTQVADHYSGQEDNLLRKASLLNKADTFLLEVLTAGYSTTEIQQAISLAIDRWQSISLNASPPSRIINFAGSHDLALKWLADHFLFIAPGYELKTIFTGSLGGLFSLSQGQVDLAGAHLWDAELDVYNDSFIRKVFPGRQMAAITLAYRRLGLLVPPHNPHDLRSIPDIVERKIRYVNRQAGSGTRVWFDIQLQKAGIPSNQVHGYENEKATHSDLARAIIDGEGDTGLGLEAVASAFGLDCVVLTNERYDLILPFGSLEMEAFQLLLEYLKKSETRQILEGIGGYDCSHTGTVRIIQS